MTDFLKVASYEIAYEKIEGESPGVMFCGGFGSDMTGTKAVALKEACKKIGQAYVCFDYRAHGQSSGDWLHATIGSWKEDALAVLDQVTQGPQILVGSSLGGWIALLLALARPQRVHAMIGIAAAPDFTEDLIWQNLTTEQQNEVTTKGVTYVPSTYSNEPPHTVTKKLLDEGKDHLLLRDTIALQMPVRLLHGMQDHDVPWQRSLLLAEKLQSNNVHLNLIKDGDHRLARDQDLNILRETLMGLLKL